NTYRNKYNRDLQADLKEELAGSDYYKAFDMLQKEPKNLEERKEQMTEKLSRGRNSGDVWSQVSNNIMDVFSEEGRNVDDSERELRDTYKQVEKIEKQGGKPDTELLEKLDKAENKVKVNIDDYEESKNKVADGLSTAASITTAVATSAVVTLATGGVGTVAVPLIIGSAITCATTKVAINKIVKGNSYDLNSTQALTDFTTGAVEGALNAAGGPLMDKFCKLPALQKITVMNTIMKNPVITKALSKGTIEGVTSFVENKAVQEIVKDAITDAITSGVQGGLTTAMDEGTWSDGIGEGLLKVGESGAVQGGVGLATSVAMGTTLKAGEHILGKFKPKADTPDGLEVKLKDPEKFSKAKKILSEGSHSETELTQKLKDAGFKDEDIKSVLEHKSSLKTAGEEPSVKETDGKKDTEVKEIGSNKTDINEVSKTDLKYEGMGDEETFLEICAYDIKGTPKTAGETIRDIRKDIKPNILKIDNMSVPFYGTKAEAEIIEKALKQLPDGIKDKLAKPKNFIEKFCDLFRTQPSKESLIKGIYVSNDTIFKKLDGTICEGTKGVCILPNGEIILYPQVLNKDLLVFQEKCAGEDFFNEIKGKSLKELNDLKSRADLEGLELMHNHGKMVETYDYNQKVMNRIQKEIGKNNNQLDNLNLHYNEIDNQLQKLEDYAKGNLNKLDKEFISRMDSYSDKQLDKLWNKLNDELDDIEFNYEKISRNNKAFEGQFSKLKSELEEMAIKKKELHKEMLQKSYEYNLLSDYTHQIGQTSERWFDTFNHEVFHRLDYLQGEKIIGKHNVLRIDKKQLGKFQGISEETKKKLDFLLDRDISYGTQKELKYRLTKLGIDGREANIIMEKFKLKTSCFSEKAFDTPFYTPSAHDISGYASNCQSASETAAETFKSLMKEWRDYGNNDDIPGFLSKLKQRCKGNDTKWDQYAFIANNYLENDLPKISYIGDSRSPEKMLNTVMEVQNKILRLSDDGEKKIAQTGSDRGEIKITQSRTSQIEPAEGVSENIPNFEAEGNKSHLSTNTERFTPGDYYEQSLPDEPSDAGTVEPSDIADGEEKGLTDKEVIKLRHIWNIGKNKKR
ncbi:MAG: hypothetical protein ABRQ38_23775, partial [Candidatus Eremiobacterota bacterium]